MEKLVRKNIPEIIQKDTGKEPFMRVVEGEEYSSFLVTKLQEEVGEYLGSGNPEELADILEAVYAIAKTKNISPHQLEETRAKKKKERGGFEKGIIIDFK